MTPSTEEVVLRSDLVESWGSVAQLGQNLWDAFWSEPWLLPFPIFPQCHVLEFCYRPWWIRLAMHTLSAGLPRWSCRCMHGFEPGNFAPGCILLWCYSERCYQVYHYTYYIYIYSLDTMFVKSTSAGILCGILWSSLARCQAVIKSTLHQESKH